MLTLATCTASFCQGVKSGKPNPRRFVDWPLHSHPAQASRDAPAILPLPEPKCLRHSRALYILAVIHPQLYWSVEVRTHRSPGEACRMNEACLGDGGLSRFVTARHCTKVGRQCSTWRSVVIAWEGVHAVMANFTAADAASAQNIDPAVRCLTWAICTWRERCLQDRWLARRGCCVRDGYRHLMPGARRLT